MNSPWLELATCGLAYLAGSVPFGLLVARAVAGVDIRKEGSGNIGATNVGRVLGAKWGITVLVLDAFKGFLPVWLVPLVLTMGQEESSLATLHVIAGVATVVGHMFPCWLKFKGGKGVATALGVVLFLAEPGGSLTGLVGFTLCMVATRIVSLSSMVAAIAFAIGQIAILWPNPFNGDKLPLAVFSLAVPTLIVLRHRSNIRRLLRGEESAFQFGGSKRTPADTEHSSSAADSEKQDEANETAARRVSPEES